MPKSSTKSRVQTQHGISASSVPYARGFKPPTERQKMKAIGYKQEVPKEYEPGELFFPALPQPISIDDWLAQYVEEGQTYDQFRKECPWLSNRKPKYMKQVFIPQGRALPEKYPEGCICLQPLGDFSKYIDAPDFSALAQYAECFFCFPVQVLPPVTLDISQDKVYWVDNPQDDQSDSKVRRISRVRKHELKSRYESNSKQRQLCIDTVLLNLKRTIPPNAICLIALTMEDLYEAPSDLFVAGMAAGNHRVAAFSFKRYDPTMHFSQEFWYKIHQGVAMKQDEKQRIILLRCCKLLVHEISHLLGVDHCIFYSCCMNGSGHLEEDFRQAMNLCPVDLRKLQTLCGFDVVKRYKKLAGFFKKHGFKEELSWVEKRLKFLTNE